MRSSEKLGDAGPPGERGGGGGDSAADSDVVLERATTEGLREVVVELGIVGARDGGCCRIRRRPDRPSPCSWSVTGDGLTHFRLVSIMSNHIFAARRRAGALFVFESIHSTTWHEQKHDYTEPTGKCMCKTDD